MIENKTYYPTPEKIIWKMWSKINSSIVSTILEPSAGQGHIAEFIKRRGSREEISCIEIDQNFQSILRGKKFKVIDSDFLAYSGSDRFDLIIANPPFNEGGTHLMKAIDIMYSGQIVFLLNAETLKNPFCNDRKALVQRLEELNADIEYIPDAFVNAERKTPVEIALVYINIERDIADDLFRDCTDKAKDYSVELDEEKELMSSNNITSRVEIYQKELSVGLEFIQNYFKASRYVGQYFELEKNDFRYCNTWNAKVNAEVNRFVSALRKDHWKKILDMKEVSSRMTEKKVQEFHHKVEEQGDMEFNESNIRSFIISLIGSYEQTMTEAVEEIFDRLTRRYSWADETDKNIHYFNGWSTNKAFYVNKKVIVPAGSGYGASHPFIGYSGDLRVDRWVLKEFNDIDKVMNYFDGSKHYEILDEPIPDDFQHRKEEYNKQGYDILVIDGNSRWIKYINYVSIFDAIEKAFKEPSARLSEKIYSTYFEIVCYKKRTVHLTFRSEDILRRFNVCACKHKKWLPEDYGKKKYSDMSEREKAVVAEFEGKDKYSKNLNQIGFAPKNFEMIA